MSSRRDRERSPKTRLRMDSYQGRNGRGSSRNREREIDSVMKKARSQRSGSQSTYWNKKLLEAEEKDPNRWRHSGYKELYHGDKRGSRSHSESGSLSNSKSRSKSPLVVKSPRRVRSPKNDRAKSPNWSPKRHSRGRISFSRSPRNSPARRRSPKRLSIRRESREKRRVRSPRRNSRDKSLERSRSPRVRRRSPPRTPPRRPPSPRAKCRSESCSSESSSSCSNDSCSVCSPKRKSSKEREPKRTKERRSIERKHRERVKARHRVEERSRSRSLESRSRGEKVPVKRKVLPEKSMHRSPFIKVESDSDSSSRESVSAGAVAGPRISLSERFGRMAQWSVDRDLELRNLRITADRDRFTVEMDNPPSPLYPPSLSTINEFGSSWDDIRVRYAYYKERGYLRDLTIQDYVKWEQWWYKYQDWLENDSYYDRYHYYRRRP